jgi:ketosteroid isomerase-like protein
MEGRLVVEAYFKAISERRFADAAAFFAPDVILWLAGEGSWPLGGLHDRQGILSIHALVQDRFPGGLKIILHRIIAEGEDVVAEIETLGTRRDGQIYNNHYAQMFVVRAGKIVSRREYLDTIHARDLLLGPIG